MGTSNIITIDPIPRLHVTPKIEQTLVLLLALYQVMRVASGKELLALAQAAGYWRGEWPDFNATWTELTEKKGHIGQMLDGDGYSFSRDGLARLLDLSVLAFALRDAFNHLATPGYVAVCKVKKEMVRRPFTTRAVSREKPRWGWNKHHVYVILLQAEAVVAYPSLIETNPERRTNHACLYVGQTGSTPEKRFKQHKNGRKASEMVKRFGICLVPDLYAHMNPINGRGQAEATERDFAAGLRQHGYTVSAGHHDSA